MMWRKTNKLLFHKNVILNDPSETYINARSAIIGFLWGHLYAELTILRVLKISESKVLMWPAKSKCYVIVTTEVSKAVVLIWFIFVQLLARLCDPLQQGFSFYVLFYYYFLFYFLLLWNSFFKLSDPACGEERANHFVFSYCVEYLLYALLFVLLLVPLVGFNIWLWHF